MESNTDTWRDVTNAYAKALFERGKVRKPEAESLTFEEGGPFALWVVLTVFCRNPSDHVFASISVWASSMYVKTVQTKALGWEPRFTVNEEILVEGIDEGLASLKL